MATITLKKVQNLSKKLGVGLTFKRPDNGFGGYDNGSTKIFYDAEKSEVYLISTCMNCGDGTWVNVENLIN